MNQSAPLSDLVKNLISANKLNEAVQVLKSVFQNSPNLKMAILAARRWEDLKEQIILGTISRDEISKYKSQISEAIYEISELSDMKAASNDALRSELNQSLKGFVNQQNSGGGHNIQGSTFGDTRFETNIYQNGPRRLDEEFSCTFCGELHLKEDIVQNDKIDCRNCKRRFQAYPEFATSSHLNVKRDDLDAFLNIRTRIHHQLQLPNFRKAHAICQEGYDRFSRNPEVLVLIAYCAYMAYPDKIELASDAETRNEIVKFFEFAQKEDPTYGTATTSNYIADNFYRYLKNRFDTVPNKAENLGPIQIIIDGFNFCGELNPNKNYYEQYISNLQGHHGYSFYKLERTSEAAFDQFRDILINGTDNEQFFLKDCSKAYYGIASDVNRTKSKILRRKPNYVEPPILFEFEGNYITISGFVKIHNERERQKRLALEREARIRRNKIIASIAAFVLVFALIYEKCACSGPVDLTEHAIMPKRGEQMTITISRATAYSQAPQNDNPSIRGYLNEGNQIEISGEQTVPVQRIYEMRNSIYRVPFYRVRIISANGNDCRKCTDQIVWIHGGAFQTHKKP